MLSQGFLLISFWHFCLYQFCISLVLQFFLFGWICRVFSHWIIMFVCMGKCGVTNARFCFFYQFYLKIRLFVNIQCIVVSGANCGTIFHYDQRYWGKRNSICKKHFLVLSIPVKSGWSFYTKKRCKGEVLLWSILTNVNCCVNIKIRLFGLQMHCFWSKLEPILMWSRLRSSIVETLLVLWFYWN
jgi:hypothetical protein